MAGYEDDPYDLDREEKAAARYRALRSERPQAEDELWRQGGLRLDSDETGVWLIQDGDGELPCECCVSEHHPRRVRLGDIVTVGLLLAALHERYDGDIRWVESIRWEAEQAARMRASDEPDDGYEPDDPKSSGFYDRMVD